MRGVNTVGCGNLTKGSTPFFFIQGNTSKSNAAWNSYNHTTKGIHPVEAIDTDVYFGVL